MGKGGWGGGGVYVAKALTKTGPTENISSKNEKTEGKKEEEEELHLQVSSSTRRKKWLQ